MNISPLLRCAAAVVTACCLLCFAGTARAQAVLDQWYDSSCLPNDTFSVNTGIEDAQTFVPGVTGPLTRVDIYVSALAPTSGNMLVDIRSTVGALPAGTLGTGSVAAAMLPAAPGWATFLFAPAPNVVAGQQYAIVVYGDPTFSSGTWYATGGNNYPSGTAYRRSSLPPITPWANSTVSFGFRTFVGNAPYPALPAPCTQMPPPGSGGGSGGSKPAAAGPAGEGSFAADPPTIQPATAPASGEGGFGVHVADLSAQGAARPPALAGPFTASLTHISAGVAAAPPPGTSLQVFNVSYQNQGQSGGSAPAATLPPLLGWLLLAGLSLGAVLALGKGLQGLASSQT